MAHENYRVKFDPDKIIDHFGGVPNAVIALQKIGMDAKGKTLQKQRERGNMHADMVASLVLASVKIGRPLNLYQCLLMRQDEKEDA